MKKLITLLFAATSLVFVACSSDDDDNASGNLAFELNATGSVADQTPEQAKKTINGSWTVAASASKAAAKGNANSCTFYGIEFTDDRYAIALQIAGQEDLAIAYGTYTMNEASDGTVSSVDLYETVDGNNTKIAALTNIVVVETANELRATFDVVFTLPDEIENICGSSLSGNYSADKDEVVAGAENATDDSNFAKLINTWRVSAYTNNEGATLATSLQYFCLDEETDMMDPDCETPSAVEVSFSAYGSYIFVYKAADGSTIEADVDSWEFNNSAQTELLIDGEMVGTIDQLTDTTLIVSFSDDGYNETWTFTRVD